MNRTLTFLSLLLLVTLSHSAAVIQQNNKSNTCLWMSKIDAILNHEAMKPQFEGQVASCILRQGRTVLLQMYGCYQNSPPNFVDEAECKKCVTKQVVLDTVISCKSLDPTL